ncbi:hypothetical protein IH992_09720 [Candidatus Poribacteria bacterium]|nr:hypothetical protein [Candidatus Poribacteria bacterium]
MSEVALSESGIDTPAALLRAMLAVLRNYWDEATRYQKVLYILGLVSIGSGILHTGVWLVKGGSLAGPVSWRKPIVFGFSVGLTLISIAWVMTYLPKHRVKGWLLSSAIGIAFFGEVFLIDMQQWRGVPSHFNFSTPFDAAVFSVMGSLIVLVEIIVIIVALWSFISLQAASSSFTWAIRVGLALLVVGQIFGNLIIRNGIPKVIDLKTGEFISEGVKSAYIFGAAGSIKIPHALSLHAILVLPVLAFLLRFTNWDESQRTRAVIAAVVGYIGLVAVTTFQTFSGLAPFDLSLSAALMMGVSVILIAATYAIALIVLQQTLAQNAAGQGTGD